MRRRWFAVLLAIAAGGAAAEPAPRDLDVRVPSGTPLEWMPMTPQRYVRPEGAFELVRAGERGRYAPQNARASIATVAIAQPGELLTYDFASHLQWQQPATTGPRAGITGPRSALGHVWPLPFDEELYWRASGLLLQALLHPGRVLRSEIGAQLLELGEGAHGGLAAAGSLEELGSFANGLRAAIGPAPLRPLPPGAPAGADAAAAMLLRFVAEELCAARPYANDFQFGRRLALLREETLPWAALLASGDQPLLQRNAVAFLAMIDAPTATDRLARVASEERDPVARARALHALARRRARGAAPAIRALLATESSPWLRALECHALGAFGDAEAIPLLIADKGLAADDGEALLERLGALTRIDAGARTPEVDAFTRRFCETTPYLRHLAKVSQRGPAPDSPDPPDARVVAIVQLARLVAARLAPGDRPREEAALAPFQQPALPAGRFSQHSCTSFGAVAPLARHAFADALGRLGERGAALAAAIAADRSCEPELRLAAIEGMENPGRLDFAAALGADPTEELLVRLEALELLDRANDLRAVDLAAAFAAEGGLQLDRTADAATHWRVLLVAQVLGRRGRLSATDLIAALAATLPGARAPDGAAAWVDAFLDDAIAIGLARERLRKLAAELRVRVAQVTALPALAGEELEREAAWIAGQAEAVVEHARDAGVRAAAASAILERLTPSTAGGAALPRDLFAEIPLRETLLMELARIGDDAALDRLAACARDAAFPDRAAACVALGATRRTDAAPHLVYLLRADDPFLRLCAWAALRRLTGQSFGACWLEGDPAEREQAQLEWARFVARSGK